MSGTRHEGASRRLPWLVLVVMVVPTLALGWLAIELVGRDRQLERDRARERAAHAASQIVAASQARLVELEVHLQAASSGGGALPAGVSLVIVEGTQLDAKPAGALVFRPVVPTSTAPPSATFAEADRLEHQQDDHAGAIANLRPLIGSSDPAIRAGALLRLGRNQRKARQADAALATYRELGTLSLTIDAGLPAALLAHVAQGEILRAAGRVAELRDVGEALRTHLAAGAWPLGRDAYEFYAAEADRWAGPVEEMEVRRDARSIAAAFQTIYDGWAAGGPAPARQWLVVEGRPVLLATVSTRDRLVAMLAASEFLQEGWRHLGAFHVQLTDVDGQSILGRMPDGLEAAVVPPDQSRLPWTLRVADAGSTADDGAAIRRRLLIAGLATLLVLIAGSAYFTLRGVTRELAVARLQSDFVSAVSHEFRTPLASIRHLSDMLSRGRVSHEGERQQSYDFLSRESERLERLVGDLLDFGRAENGAYKYRFEPTDAVAFIRELAGVFAESVAAKGHRLSVSTEVESAFVMADREALSRAIWNLVDNAVKYSPEADQVWITLGVDDDFVVIRVRDEGLGIAASEIDDIFRKFVRGSNVQARQIKGTGIGLAMVRHIVEAHRGEVRVESAPNHGSTFALRLPIERTA